MLQCNTDLAKFGTPQDVRIEHDGRSTPSTSQRHKRP
jgi:hypothetical protein